MKIAIVGAGFFGTAIALKLKNSQNQIDLYEKENDILQNASKKNQFRFHLGYHYPRSQNTFDELKKSNKLFSKFYTEKVFNKTKNYYAISNKNSKTSLTEFLNFVNKNNLFINQTKEKYNKKFTSKFFLTKEKNLNYFNFKKKVFEKLKSAKINIFTNSAFKKKQIQNYDKIIVCCYANNNSVLHSLGIKNLPKLKYELVEKIIVKLPRVYKNKSYIILDGNFACLDPYLGTDYHLFSDVKNSKVEIVHSKFPLFNNIKKNYLKNNNLVDNIRISNFKKFIKNTKKYLPFISKSKYIGSYYVTRVLSLNSNSKNKDERLSHIKLHNKKIISVLAGKWNTCILASKEIKKLIHNEK